MDSTNAVAGPSKPRNSPSPILGSASNSYSHNLNHPLAVGEGESVPLFLRPAVKSSQIAYIKSTNDLLGQFQLHEAYNKYVTPFYATTGEGGSGVGAGVSAGEMSVNGPASPMTPGPGGVDKGKGREVPIPGSTPAAHAQTPAADGQDGDDEEGGGKGEKKKKNSYKHLIKGVPGKHSLKKDDYFGMLMAQEPKSRTDIRIFASNVLRDSFHVSLEGIKGWNTSTLVVESAQAREDRRKRKELKRLAKAQLQAHQALAAASATTPNSNSNPIQAPIPTSATSGSFPPVSAPRPEWAAPSGTPRPTGTPRPPTAGVGANNSGTSSTVSAIPRPGSARPPPVQVPAPGVRVSTPHRTGTPTAPHPLSAPPVSAGSLGGGFPGAAGAGRGQKRPREDIPSANGVAGGVQTNGVANAPSPPKPIIGAKAGNNGVRPRPLKKQRMGSQAPVQQPTPQGV